MNDTPHDNAGRTRPSLLMRLRDDADNEAWRTFVTVYTPAVYGYARQRGLQDADAADIAQEVLMEVARCIQSFEYQPDKGRFRDWLGLITRRRLGRFFAKRSGRPEALHDDQPGDADAEWSAIFHTSLLEAALERIRPDFESSSWAAFDAIWLQDQPAAAVAKKLDLSVAAVYVAKSRILKRLREQVLELAEDVPQFVPIG